MSPTEMSPRLLFARYGIYFRGRDVGEKLQSYIGTAMNADFRIPVAVDFNEIFGDPMIGYLKRLDFVIHEERTGQNYAFSLPEARHADFDFRERVAGEVGANEIPVYLLARNNFTQVKQAIEQLAKYVDLRQVVVVDNASSYPPLIEYYMELESRYPAPRIVRMSRDFGRQVVLEQLAHELPQVFAMMDAGFRFGPKLPSTFLMELYQLTVCYGRYKAGLATDLGQKKGELRELKRRTTGQTLRQWELQHYLNRLSHPDLRYRVYEAEIGTTFAVYNRKYARRNESVRVGGDFTCGRRTWYIDDGIPEEERSWCESNRGDVGNWVELPPERHPGSGPGHGLGPIPRVSIVMAYFNRKSQVQFTLRTISDSIHKNIEVIIVDDQSAPQEQLDDCLHNFPELDIKYIKIKEKIHINPCVVYNIGFRQVTGDIVVFQNPECCHIGDVLTYLTQNISSLDYWSFSCADMYYPHANELLYQIYECESDSERRDSILQLIEGQCCEEKWRNHPVRRPVAYHFLTAITREGLRKLGGFDERYADGSCFDDAEIIERAKVLGLKVKIVGIDSNEPFVVHQWHSPNHLHIVPELERRNREIFLAHMKSLRETQPA
ncbi:MAG: glycosyltransferase family 2 protein [Sulfobacillus sp.]